MPEASTDHLSNARWKRKRLRCAAAHHFQSSLRGEQPHDFADEQRVALGAVMDRGHRVLGRAHAGARLDQAPHLRFAESRQRDPVSGALASEFCHDRSKRSVGFELHVSIGASDKQRRGTHLARHELEEQQGWLIRGVEVVEHQDQRLRLGGIDYERGHGLEETEPRRPRLERARSGQVRDSARSSGRIVASSAPPAPSSLCSRSGSRSWT